METNNIFDGAFDRMIEDEAWQRLSSSYPFSAELLEQYKDRLDWHSVSGNSNICWTVTMLEKFKKLIDWRELSDSSQESLFSAEILLKFKDCWDWSVISGRQDLSDDTISKVKDFIVWREFISNYRNSERCTKEFYDKYKEYIPSALLKDSYFYSNMVDMKVKEMEQMLCRQ